MAFTIVEKEGLTSKMLRTNVFDVFSKGLPDSKVIIYSTASCAIFSYKPLV